MCCTVPQPPSCAQGKRWRPDDAPICAQGSAASGACSVPAACLKSGNVADIVRSGCCSHSEWSQSNTIDQASAPAVITRGFCKHCLMCSEKGGLCCETNLAALNNPRTSRVTFENCSRASIRCTTILAHRSYPGGSFCADQCSRKLRVLPAPCADFLFTVGWKVGCKISVFAGYYYTETYTKNG